MRDITVAVRLTRRQRLALRRQSYVDLARRLRRQQLQEAGWDPAEYAWAMEVAAATWMQRRPWCWLPYSVTMFAFRHLGRAFATDVVSRWRAE